MKRTLILSAKILSVAFSPFYAPLWAYIWLFLFSRFSVMTTGYKLYMMVMVAAFTIIIPRLTIYVFRRLNNWSRWQISHRQHRHIPYLLSLLSYATCFMLMTQTNTWMFFRSIIMAALVAQAICFIVNVWWKISTHMVGMGGLLGMVISFSFVFYFNPLLPMCVLILLSGLLGTARMILRQHSLMQILVGYLVGMTCSLCFLLTPWYDLFAQLHSSTFGS